jgi:hypothetical protein
MRALKGARNDARSTGDGISVGCDPSLERCAGA